MFTVLCVAQIVLIHMSVSKVLPKALSKGFLKLGCSPDQVYGLEQIFLAQKCGQKDEMIISFLSGKKQRRKAKLLLKNYAPDLNIHKCKIENSYCLRLRSAHHAPNSSFASSFQESGENKAHGGKSDAGKLSETQVSTHFGTINWAFDSGAGPTYEIFESPYQKAEASRPA